MNELLKNISKGAKKKDMFGNEKKNYFGKDKKKEDSSYFKGLRESVSKKKKKKKPSLAEQINFGGKYD